MAKPPAKGKPGTRTTGKTQPSAPKAGQPTKGGSATSVVKSGGKKSSPKAGTKRSPSEIVRDRRIRKRKLAAALSRGGGTAISNSYTKGLINRRMAANVSLSCMPTVDVLSNKRFTRRLAGGNNKDWICKMEDTWKYREEKYSVQNNEFRLFIEGVEVTNYVQGTISWTLESTGGMNTCRFQLNNTQDAFILTPDNLCAGTDKGGWRLSGGGKVSLGPSRTLWRNFAVDETAKYLLYKRKYDEVMKNLNKTKIDKETGMWLYPLGPYRCIVHKHDPVRLFIRLPNTAGIATKVKKKFWKYGELWAPAFTGFVKDYSWDDNPVEGTRTLSITCYDYRGLFNRMRVRVEALPQDNQSDPGKKADGTAAVLRTVKAAGSAARAELAASWNQFLIPAMNCGNYWEKYLTNAYPDKLWPKWNVSGKTFGVALPPTQDKPKKVESRSVRVLQNKNPYTLMNQEPFKMRERLIKLWKNGLKYYLRVKYHCLTDVNTETLIIGGKGRTKEQTAADLNCAQKAIANIDRVLRPFAVRIVQTFGYSMLAILRLWQLKKDKFQFYVGGTPDLPEISLKRVASTTGGRKAQQRKSKRKKEVNTGTAKLSDLVTAYIMQWEDSKAGSVKRAGGSVTKNLPKFWGSTTTAGWYVDALKHDAELKKATANGIKAKAAYDKDKNSFAAKTYFATARKAKEAAKAAVANDYKLLGEYQEPLLALEAKILKVLNDPTDTPVHIKNRFSEYFTLKKKTKKIKNVVKNYDGAKGFGASIAAANAALASGNLANLSSGLEQTYVTRNRKAHESVSLARQQQIIENKIKTFKDALAGIKGFVESGGLKSYEDMFRYLSTSYENKNIKPLQKWPGKSGNAWNSRDTTLPRGFPWINGQFKYLYNLTKKGLEKDKNLTRRGRAKLGKITEKWIAFINNTNQQKVDTTKRLTDRYIDFNAEQAGMFADLVAANKGLAHPLMGKSFEQAVQFLTTGGESQLLIGAVYDLDSYSSGVLREWNRVTVFGAVQRPLTYQEVSAIGQGSNRNIDSVFSPINAFVHLLRPKQGTGAATIVQTDTASGVQSMQQAPTYETRKSLLDKICQALDYQFYVSPMGDLVFEIPNYNAFPADFGPTFEKSYELSKEWISSTISEENSDVATAYKFTGQTYDKKLEALAKAKGVRKKMQKTFIWSILARRIGVQQQDIVLQIPGVGDPSKSRTTYTPDPQNQLLVYALFYMQRQLGRMHTLMVRHPFRPYMLPNRPIWLIPRQRIGLPQSITHSMSAPDGVCTTESQLIYTREMFRDGTFRFVGGGQRQPIDYARLLSGDASAVGRVGDGKAGNFGYGTLSAKGRFSRSQILNRLRRSSSFSSQMGATFGNYFKYKPVKTKSPPSPAPTKRKTIDMPAAGVNVDPPVGTKPKSPGGGITRSTGSSYFQQFYSPWASGAAFTAKNNHAFRSFGYLRAFQKGQYRKVQNQSRGKERWHGGIDILCPKGTLAKAPIHLQRLTCQINANLGGGKLKGIKLWVPDVVNRRITGFLSTRAKKRYAKDPVSIFFAKGFKKFPGGGGTFYDGRIWSNAWEQWKKVTNNGTTGGGSVYLGKNYAVGIMLIGFGWIYPPLSKDPNEKLWSKLIWVHLDHLHVGTNGKGQKGYFGADVTQNIDKGTNIGPMWDRGSTGTPHLHFEVWVRPGKGSTATQRQLDLFKTVRQAQKDYLQTQLVAMARGWKFEAGKMINPNNLDGYASDYWQRRGKRLWIRVNPKTGKTYRPTSTKGSKRITVKEVVAYYQRLAVWKKYVRQRDSRYHKDNPKKGVDYLRVNPAQWFKCEDLLDVTTAKGSRTFKRLLLEACGKAEASTGGNYGGYRPASPRGGGSAYTPPPLAWCNASMGRKKAGGDAKAAQARSKAQQKTATNPVNAKKTKKDLKKKLDKANAVKKQIEKNNKDSKKTKAGRSKATRNVNAVAKKQASSQRTPGMAAGNSGRVQGNPDRPTGKSAAAAVSRNVGNIFGR